MLENLKKFEDCLKENITIVLTIVINFVCNSSKLYITDFTFVYNWGKDITLKTNSVFKLEFSTE